MTFVLQYGPPMLADVLLALTPIMFLVSSLRAQRRHTTPPRAIWATLVLIATTWILALLDSYHRAHPGDVDTFWKDMMVAIGAAFRRVDGGRCAANSKSLAR